MGHNGQGHLHASWPGPGKPMRLMGMGSLDRGPDRLRIRILQRASGVKRADRRRRLGESC